MSESSVRSLDLGHGAILVREFQQVEIGVGDHDVFRLAADPAAHVDVAVGRAGPRRIDVQADAGLAFLAIAAAPAGDVERHRDQVADLDEFDVAARLDHFAGDFVAENQARGAVVRPRTMCWSLPQMLVETIFRMTP